MTLLTRLDCTSSRYKNTLIQNSRDAIEKAKLVS